MDASALNGKAALEKHQTEIKARTPGWHITTVFRHNCTQLEYKIVVEEVNHNKDANILMFCVHVDGFVYESRYPGGVLKTSGIYTKLRWV